MNDHAVSFLIQFDNSIFDALLIKIGQIAINSYEYTIMDM
jgi:hypothetical protein